MEPATELDRMESRLFRAYWDDGLLDLFFGLGVLGMPGLTAYVGLLDIGQPKAGDTLVLAASTGAVGSASSNGCLRATDPDVSRLADRIPLGTPVFIEN